MSVSVEETVAVGVQANKSPFENLQHITLAKPCFRPDFSGIPELQEVSERNTLLRATRNYPHYTILRDKIKGFPQDVEWNTCNALATYLQLNPHLTEKKITFAELCTLLKVKTAVADVPPDTFPCGNVILVPLGKDELSFPSTPEKGHGVEVCPDAPTKQFPLVYDGCTGLSPIAFDE